MTRNVALITGSGKQRVGSVVAVELARRGYDIALHYRTSASEAAQMVTTLQTLGVQAIALHADLTNEAAVKQLIAQTHEHFGRLDVLVNCAAVWGRKKLEETTAADVLQQFTTNTLGTFLCSQHAGLLMVQQPTGGVIINIGDWAEARPYLDYAAYFVSKGSIPTLTRCLAHELGSRNPRVRVNAVLPGPVMLPPDLPEHEKQQAINATLVKREGRPDHLALAVCSLIENDFITGVCLPVDGGRTIYAPE